MLDIIIENLKKYKLYVILHLLIIAMFCLCYFFQSTVYGTIALMIHFIFNLYDDYSKKKKLDYFIFFHGFIFLFILSRVFIGLQPDYDYSWEYTFIWIFKSYVIISLSLFGLFIGNKIKLNIKVKNLFLNKLNPSNENLLINIFFVLTTLTIIFSFIKGIILYLTYVNNYAAMYINPDAAAPYLIRVIATLSDYILIIFLCLRPNKKKTCIALSLYILSGLPLFILGGRGQLMYKVFSAFIYVFIRNSIDDEIWIKKIHKKIILVLIPFMMIGLGIVNYTRSNEKVPTKNPVILIEDFLYKQGTSYITLVQTVKFENQLQTNKISYSIGNLIDFPHHNQTVANLLNIRYLPYGNNEQNGKYSNNIQDRLSYLVFKDKYLQGNGRGTTYFSEIYLDFGYIGLILFSMLLAIVLNKINNIFKLPFILRVIFLNILFNLFYIPRYAVFSMLGFTINYLFYASIIIYLVVNQIVKRYNKYKNN